MGASRLVFGFLVLLGLSKDRLRLKGMVICALLKCTEILDYNVLFRMFHALKCFLGAGKMSPTRSFLEYHILLDTSKNSYVLCSMLLKFNDEWR